MSMAAGVEVRVPFLDRDLIPLCFQSSRGLEAQVYDPSVHYQRGGKNGVAGRNHQPSEDRVWGAAAAVDEGRAAGDGARSLVGICDRAAGHIRRFGAAEAAA